MIFNSFIYSPNCGHPLDALIVLLSSLSLEGGARLLQHYVLEIIKAMSSAGLTFITIIIVELFSDVLLHEDFVYRENNIFLALLGQF